ncbi:MAG: hypothetical protein II726_00345 [Elusimicrobiaceae bacterium]|nr:hypothetical protein [Elusimicrobiaceae bacterium]
MKKWFCALILLPFNVLVIIPMVILYFTNFTYQFPNILQFICGLIVLLGGMLLSGWSMGLFYKIGKGTLAPWAAPKHLVVQGPYKFVRNPMIIGVILILLAEALLLNTRYIFYWAVVFFILNNIYFHYFEEKQLKKTFGKEYLDYKKQVPMWLPKFNK